MTREIKTGEGYCSCGDCDLCNQLAESTYLLQHGRSFLPPSLYREGEQIIKAMGSGYYCAVTLHTTESEHSYYLIRERSDNIDKLKDSWSFYNARFVTIDELMKLPFLPDVCQ